MNIHKKTASCLIATGLIASSAAIADGSITGTIPATRAQRPQWTAMTKISMEDAKEIALRATPGVVDDVDLELKNGFLVYEVEVDDSAGLEHEFIIDAGNGTVLKKKIDD